MKSYRELYIRKAEIAQLILLHQLYTQNESRHLIFQGGTAIRWCYGGSRFSEDLDFVTSLAPVDIQKILQTVIKGAGKLMIPHFGTGTITLKEKNARTGNYKCFVDFNPDGVREKISIKLEFERLTEGKLPDTQNHVLSLMSPVAYLITAGEFRVPRPNVVINTQTPAEILSDKIRALLERQYLKGRDFFDLWYLHRILKTPLDVGTVKRKLALYREVFISKRPVEFFIKPSKKDKEIMCEAIEQDLSRFLPPDVLSVHRANRYEAFLESACYVFSELNTKGVHMS
jgi:predicted nucleotidyltransferase component of viral defense system